MKLLALRAPLAALLTAASVAAAQGLDRPLTWSDCVDIAARRNPELAAAALAVDAGKASYYGSFNGVLPRLSLSNSYSDSSGSSSNASRWQAQASASLSLFDAGQFAGIRAASARLDQAKASRQLASSELRSNLRRAFAQLLFVQTSVDVSRSILELREKSSELVTLRYNSGRESLGNMLRSKAQRLQAQADLARSLRDVRTARRSLLREMGMDEFSAIVATGTLAAGDLPAFPADARALAAARPDVAARRVAIEQARAGLSQARSGYWPSLSASYSRTRTGASEFPSTRYGWSVSGLLSYPLFGGGPTAVFFESAAAKKSLAASEQNLRAALDRAAVELESAWADFAAAADQARVRAALLEASRQRNAEADVRYASGLVSYDNWEIIASDRINSERAAVQSTLDAVNAQTAWERALGAILERQ